MNENVPRTVSLRTAAGVGVGAAAFATAVFFAGVYAAHADPGGLTRPSLSFAGTLRGASGALTFTFHRAGGSDCIATTETVTPDATTGAFSVEVPLTACPAFFDGSDVTFDVAVGATPVATAQRINAVPYARYADQAGVGSDCPAGYARDNGASASPGIVCARTVTLGATAVRDEVVKVGTGSSAFWIDRYEAIAHQASSGAALGTATAMGTAADDIPATGLPRNGQRPRGTASPVWALSHPGMPSLNITWFQAMEACAAAGKQLPTGSQWLRGASGTLDDGTCNSASSGARAASAADACVSASGAHDMIGNVWEWTDEWYAGAGSATAFVNVPAQNWPADYNADGTYNVNGFAGAVALPAAAIRGGDWNSSTRGGTFALSLASNPASYAANYGFRCVVLR